MLTGIGEHRNRSGGFDAVFCSRVGRSCSTSCRRRNWRGRCKRRLACGGIDGMAPLVALRLFVEQVLHTDHACQDVVLRYASERGAQGEAQVSLSSGPYCNARRRLPLGLVERLGKRVGERLEGGSMAGWRWRGRPVKIVDGTTVT